VRRAVAPWAACAVCAAWGGASACASIAGLGDYQLASDVSDGSTTDALAEGPPDDTGGRDSSFGDDDGGFSPGDATADAPGDAGGDGPVANDAADSGVPGDGAASEGAADAAWDGPPVPPSDKGQVSCGTTSCPLPADACCELPDGSSCQSGLAMCTGGVVARCDEAADCLPGQACCATGTTAYGLATECKQTCGGNDFQACRTDAECGAGGPCLAWTCGGTVVATCGGVGAATGCH